MDSTVHSTLIGSAAEPPISFAFWNVRPDVVTDNLARFAAETGASIIAHEIAGDYGSWMDHAFETSAAPMVFYAQRAEAAQWDARGFLRALEETGPLAASLAGMDARLIEGARNAAGDLIGLTYYNGGPFAVFAHCDHAVPDDLTSWDAVLDHLRASQRGGIAHPFVPRWHDSQTGLVWSLLCHLASEGVLSLDDAGAPEAMTAALRFFDTLCREALVPPAAVHDKGDTPAVIRWASGQHVMTFTMDYLAADAAQQAGRPINVPMALPGAKGTALLPGHALLCLNARIDPAMRSRAEALLTYLGGRDATGRPGVHQRWLTDCLFAVPYPELDRDRAVQAALGRFFPAPGTQDHVARLIEGRNRAQVSPPTQQAWFLDWSSQADDLIRHQLLHERRLSPAAIADQLLHRWNGLRKAARS
jgi:multiple sugar transport system substrate-binding protein